MPLVKVEIRKGKPDAYKKALLDGVHEALVEAIKIPDWDRFQRLYELDASHFEASAEKTDNITIIEITVIKGRSFEAKKNLYRLIVDKLGRNPGIDSEDIIIVLLESPLENWCVKEGKPATDVDIGFNINV